MWKKHAFDSRGDAATYAKMPHNCGTFLTGLPWVVLSPLSNTVREAGSFTGVVLTSPSNTDRE